MLPIIGTVAGQDFTTGPNSGCAKEGWCFIAIMKRKLEVAVHPPAKMSCHCAM